MKKETYDMIYEAIYNGRLKEVPAINQQIKDENVDAKDLGKVLIAAMEAIGVEYEARRVALPQLIIGTKIFKDIIKALAADVDTSNPKKVVMGVVKNDIHDIGKNLVCGMLEVYGYRVFDLGKDVELMDFVNKVKEEDAHILGMSTLLTSTMQGIEEVVKILEKEGLRDKVKVMIGGAPITENFAKYVGVEGYAVDAIKAVKVADSLLKGENCYLG